jgi:hypothetical protein
MPASVYQQPSGLEAHQQQILLVTTRLEDVSFEPWISQMILL